MDRGDSFASFRLSEKLSEIVQAKADFHMLPGARPGLKFWMSPMSTRCSSLEYTQIMNRC